MPGAFFFSPGLLFLYIGIAQVDHSTHVVIRGRCAGVHSVTSYGSRGSTSGFRLGCKCCYLLSYLTGYACSHGPSLVATSGRVRRRVRWSLRLPASPKAPPPPTPGENSSLTSLSSHPRLSHLHTLIVCSPLPSLSPVIAVCVKEEHQDISSPDRSPSPQPPLPIESIKQERDN